MRKDFTTDECSMEMRSWNVLYYIIKRAGADGQEDEKKGNVEYERDKL